MQNPRQNELVHRKGLENGFLSRAREKLNDPRRRRMKKKKPEEAAEIPDLPAAAAAFHLDRECRLPFHPLKGALRASLALSSEEIQFYFPTAAASNLRRSSHWKPTPPPPRGCESFPSAWYAQDNELGLESGTEFLSLSLSRAPSLSRKEENSKNSAHCCAICHFLRRNSRLLSLITRASYYLFRVSSRNSRLLSLIIANVECHSLIH